MRPISFNGTAFSSLGVNAQIVRNLAGSDRSADFLARRGAAPLGNGVRAGSRAIRLMVWPPSRNMPDDAVLDWRMRRVLNLLDPLDDTPKPLVCEFQDDTDNDGVIDATYNVTTDVYVGPWNWMDGAKGLEVTLYTASDLWQRVTPTVAGPNAISHTVPTMMIVNDGAATVAPVIERSAPTSTFTDTQKTRKQITITNLGELPLDREAVMVPMDPDLTQAIGLPATVLKDGNYLATSNIGTTSITGDYTITAPQAAHLAFPVTIDAGDTEIYDAILGTTPALDLDTFTRFDGNYCALDLGAMNQVIPVSSTSTVITLSAAYTWPTDRLKGACLVIYAGTGSVQARKIAGNGPNTITVSRAFTTIPDTSSRIFIIYSMWYYDGGAVTSATTNSITDASQSFDPGTLAGGVISIYAGTGSGQSKDIVGNTPTAITISGTWGTTPDSTSRYRVKRYGYYRWYVDQVNHAEDHRGGWQNNKRYTPPSKTIFGGGDVLNGWAPAQMIPGNGDDYNQLRSTPVDVGGGLTHHFPILNATRRRGQKTRLQQEGQYDSVEYYHPWGMLGARFDYALQNQNSASGATKGICEATFWCKEAGGDAYVPFATPDDSLQASLTARAEAYYDLTPYGSPEHIAMGLAPDGYAAGDADQISNTARESDKANLRWNDTLRVWLDVAGKWSYAVGAVETIIAIDDELRIGDYALQIGQRDGQRLWMPASGSRLVLDCAEARAWIDPNPDPLFVAQTAWTTLANGVNAKSVPAGTVAGDTILTVIDNSNSAVMTPPAGHTKVASVAVGSTVHDIYQGVSAGEASLNWTYGSTPNSATFVQATYRNVGALVDVATAAYPASTANYTVGPVTADARHELVVTFLRTFGVVTVSTAPAGLTHRSLSSTRHFYDGVTNDLDSQSFDFTVSGATTAVLAALVFERATPIPMIDATYAVAPVKYNADGTYAITDRWLPVPPGSTTLTASGAPWATSGAFTLTAEFTEATYG